MTCKLPQVPIISKSRKNDSLKKHIFQTSGRNIFRQNFHRLQKAPRDSLSLSNSPAVFLLLAPYRSLFLAGFKKAFNEQALSH
ncbi:hypothetical protein CEXT_418951 [Caerostris extrusa]|uniref:Uncharacterized protein n=1 Tax=Caerostris extrusa TaxID=172846 RepID=A0AAV4PF65_CAEEX|nr:hypothetical protein CEXT_418951 [Caerostris extrusa]